MERREREGSHLVGESEGSPVNGHRAFGLKVLVDLNGLFRVDVLPLHHVPGSKSLQLIKSDCVTNNVCPVCRTWACTLQLGSPPGQRAQTSDQSPGSQGNNRCLQQRRIDGVGPKQTSCSTRTTEQRVCISKINTTEGDQVCCNYLVIIQGSSFTPVLRGGADKGDVIITWHAVLFPPVQLDHVLTARLHQPVHQTQGHKPAEGHHDSPDGRSHNLVRFIKAVR